MQDAEVIEKENIKGGITAGQLLDAIAMDGVDAYMGKYEFGNGGGSDATNFSFDRSTIAFINAELGIGGGGGGGYTSGFAPYGGAGSANNPIQLNTVNIINHNPSNNLSDWGSSFTTLGDLSTLGEMGAYYSNNLRAAKAFGNLGIAASFVGVGMDVNELSNYYNNGEGNMDGIRFSIRTGGVASGILAGSLIGGPEGLLARIPIAGAALVVEEMYDITQDWIQRVAQGSADFSNAISRGWVPGYN